MLHEQPPTRQSRIADHARDRAVITRVRRRLLRWAARNPRSYPWRSEPNPWLALTAEILLQRTRADNVVPAFERFRAAFPTPIALASAGEQRLAEAISSLGLHWRIPLLYRLAVQLSAAGTVPRDRQELMLLPGVGEYVAAAFLSLHQGQRAILIDANVVRWLCRMTGRRPGPETRRQKWVRDLAEQLTPARRFREFNYAALDFSMEVCAACPHCQGCPMQSDCAYVRAQASAL